MQQSSSFDSSTLLTDLYQLTMSYGYWKAGFANKESVFHLFFRKSPFGGGFTIAAGLESVVHFIRNFHFTSADLDYLSTLNGHDNAPLFDSAFLKYLSTMKFSCDIDAIPEGTVVFPYEPLIRIQGPLIQCQLLESPLLNLVNFPTLIATKAARICVAAQNDPVLEFGLRRAQGVDGALTASRSAYIGGCQSTSNALAGKLFGIPVSGTQGHSWIMSFDDEKEAFRNYAEYQPNNCVLLVDTYDTIEGVKKAIEVGFELRKQGKKLLGVRLDSGDLAYLSIQTRQLLDDAGFQETRIVASNELDETIISELKRQGACIDTWAVGTNLVTGGSQPALDGVYKLAAIRDAGGEWKYKLKLSEQMVKVSNPGILQVRRYMSHGKCVADAIYDLELGLDEPGTAIDPFDPTKKYMLNNQWEHQDLLRPIFRQGACVYDLPTLPLIRENTKNQLSCFHAGLKRFLHPHAYNVGMEKKLYNKKVDLIKRLREQISGVDEL